MKKLLCILLFAAFSALSAFAAETVNLTEFPDADTLISTPKIDAVTYPIEQPNGIYGTKAQIAAEYTSGKAFTDEEKADIADIGYGVSAIGIKNFGAKNALRNLVDGNWSGASGTMAYMRFDDNMYDVDGTVNESGKYRALITLNDVVSFVVLIKEHHAQQIFPAHLNIDTARCLRFHERFRIAGILCDKLNVAALQYRVIL